MTSFITPTSCSHAGRDDAASRYPYCSATGHCSTGEGGKEKYVITVDIICVMVFDVVGEASLFIIQIIILAC